MSAPRIPVELRFWKYADTSAGPEECWPWTGGCSGAGRYGSVKVNGRSRGAHVVAFELNAGTRVTPGRVVRHTCDNPPCVNPRHLVTGTPADNSRDRVERGRAPRGAAIAGAVLTEPSIPIIRSLVRQGVKQAEVARRYGVTKAAINAVIQGRTWRHVPDRPIEGVAA